MLEADIDLAAQVEELEKVVSSLQLRLAKSKAKTEALVAAVHEGAREAALIQGRPKLTRSPRRRSKGKPEAAVLLMSDWHIGKQTSSYNSDVAAKRVDRLAAKVVELTQIERADHPVNECHALLGGDFIEGLNIFPGQCVDEKTEALTPDGWRCLDDLSGRKIAVFDGETGEVRFEMPMRLHVYDHAGLMVHHRTRTVDHLATENHAMWVQTKSGNPWKRTDARLVTKPKIRVKVAADAWKGRYEPPAVLSTPKCPGWEWRCDSRDLAAFVGWFVAEGHSRRGEVSIYQSQAANPEKWGEIERLLTRLVATMPGQAGGAVTLTRRSDGFCINSTALSVWCDQFKQKANDARLPAWVRSMPRAELEALLRALRLGDGSTQAGGCSWQYTTASRGLASDVQEVAFKVGLRSHWADYKAGMWNIRGSSGSTQPKVVLTLSGGYEGVRHLESPEVVQHSGRVWCPTVSTGLWVMRRNGCVMVTGNSYEVDSTSFEQLFAAARALEGLLLNLLEEFPRVEVWEAMGNHGRLGRKGDFPREDNVDLLLYRIVRERLSGFSRLVWHPAESWFTRVQVGDYDALLIHGDQIKSFGGNVPAYGIQRKGNAWASGVLGCDFTDIYMGHFHQAISLPLANGRGRVFVNPSLESDSVYAQEFVAATGTPGQRLNFVNSTRGRVTSERVIWLD